MCQNNKILVIDDNPQRRDDLATILTFLEEETVLSCSSQLEATFAEANQSADFLMVLVGEQCQAWSEQLVDRLAQWNDEVAVVLLGKDRLRSEEHTSELQS